MPTPPSSHPRPSGADFCSTCDYDDGSCPPVHEGCTDSTASNYRSIANHDDGAHPVEVSLA